MVNIGQSSIEADEKYENVCRGLPLPVSGPGCYGSTERSWSTVYASMAPDGTLADMTSIALILHEPEVHHAKN